jgi:hypothetical protein
MQRNFMPGWEFQEAFAQFWRFRRAESIFFGQKSTKKRLQKCVITQAFSEYDETVLGYQKLNKKC